MYRSFFETVKAKKRETGMESTNFPTNNTVPLRVIPCIIPRTRKAFSSKDARLEKEKEKEIETINNCWRGGGRSWRESLIRRSGEWLKRHRSLGPLCPTCPDSPLYKRGEPFPWRSCMQFICIIEYSLPRLSTG